MKRSWVAFKKCNFWQISLLTVNESNVNWIGKIKPSLKAVIEYSQGTHQKNVYSKNAHSKNICNFRAEKKKSCLEGMTIKMDTYPVTRK